MRGLREFETLIEAAPGAVDHKDGRTTSASAYSIGPQGVLTTLLPEEIRARAARVSWLYSE